MRETHTTQHHNHTTDRQAGAPLVDMLNPFKRRQNFGRRGDQPIGVTRLRDAWTRPTLHDGFGLELVPLSLSSGLGPFVDLCKTSATVRDALLVAFRYLDNITQMGQVSVIEEPGLVRFREQIEPDIPTLEEWMIGCAVAGVRQFSSLSFAPLRVELMRPQPTDTWLFDQHFQCPVVFGAPHSEVIITGDSARIPLSTANRDRHALLRVYTDGKLSGWDPWQPLGQAQDELDDVLSAAEQAFCDGSFSQTQVAGMLGVSPRTLQKQLKSRGTRFRILTRLLYHGVTRQFMAEPKSKQSVLARALGYASQSSFQRALATWQKKPIDDHSASL